MYDKGVCVIGFVCVNAGTLVLAVSTAEVRRTA